VVAFEPRVPAMKIEILMAAWTEASKSSQWVAFAAKEAQTQSSAVPARPGLIARSTDPRRSSPTPLMRRH